jgi:hypothetical protein
LAVPIVAILHLQDLLTFRRQLVISLLCHLSLLLRIYLLSTMQKYLRLILLSLLFHLSLLSRM